MKGVFVTLLLWIFGSSCAHATSVTPDVSARPIRVVLVGASIGQEWDLPALPSRAKDGHYVFEALQVWQFDKSETLAETLMRPSRQFRLSLAYLKGLFRPSPKPPDVIVLKECSSYFPGDMRRYRELYQGWVQSVQERGVRVMVATVVPVTRERASKDPGKQASIREFNDWVRAYARREELPLLDLEAALRADSAERYLREDLSHEDGSHLNRKAYEILDGMMLEALCTLKVAPYCSGSSVQAAK